MLRSWAHCAGVRPSPSTPQQQVSHPRPDRNCSLLLSPPHLPRPAHSMSEETGAQSWGRTEVGSGGSCPHPQVPVQRPSGHGSLRSAAAPHPAQEAVLQAEEVQVRGGHGARAGKRAPGASPAEAPGLRVCAGEPAASPGMTFIPPMFTQGAHDPAATSSTLVLQENVKTS